MPVQVTIPTIDLAALKSEILNDPGGLGYAPFVTAGNDNAIRDLLNKIRSGTAADGKSYTVFRNDVDPGEVVNAIAPADFTAATQIQITKLNLLFVPGIINATLTNVRANILGIFSAASQTTRDALAAIAQRDGSRAEVLFGTGASVTSDQVASALRG